MAAPVKLVAGEALTERHRRTLDDQTRLPQAPKCKRDEGQGHQDCGAIFGYKNQAGIDRCHGFILRWSVTSATAHYSRPFEGLLDPKNVASPVWADIANLSQRTEQRWPSRRSTFRKPKGKPRLERDAWANAALSAVRAAVDHVFAGRKHRMKLFVRTIGIARAEVKIGMVKLAYNFNRLAWHEARAVPA